MEDAERRYAKRLTLGLLAYVVILAVSVPVTSAFPGCSLAIPGSHHADGCVHLHDSRIRPLLAKCRRAPATDQLGGARHRVRCDGSIHLLLRIPRTCRSATYQLVVGMASHGSIMDSRK